MVYIESAFLGDEKDMRDVSKVLRDKVVGTAIKVPVDNKLIPAFVVTNKSQITKEDERKIRESAERVCGGADQQCMEAKMAELNQQVLLSKSAQSSSAANIVKGRRLTVNILDEKGKRKRVVVPDGQMFELDGISPMDPKKPPSALPSFDYIKTQSLEFAAIAVMTFVWVFGIVATYALFARMGWGYIAWVLAFIAFIIPGSGYFIILGYFILESFVSNYTTMV
jgi:hypothetical protein